MSSEDVIVLSPLVTVNPDLSPVSVESNCNISFSCDADTLVDRADARPKCLGHRCVFLANPDYEQLEGASDPLVVIFVCDGSPSYVVSSPKGTESESYLFRFVPNGVSVGRVLYDHEEYDFDIHDDYVFMSHPVSEGDGEMFCLSSYDILLTGI